MTNTAENTRSQGLDIARRLRLPLTREESGADSLLQVLWQILWTAILVLAVFLMGVRFADASELPVPRAPEKVLVTFSGASLLASEEVTVKDGMASILLPGSARDLVVGASKGKVADRHESIVTGASLGFQGELAKRTMAQRTELSARILYLETLIKKASGKEDNLQGLCLELAKARASLKALDGDKKVTGKEQTSWKLVRLRLAGLEARERVTLTYAYTLPDVRWQPLYLVDVTPGDNGKGAIHVRLEAEVTQPAGFDWPNVELHLVAQGGDLSSLPPLRPWIIGDGPVALGSPAPRMAKAMSMAKMDNEAALLDTTGNSVQWTPLLKGLSQGTSRLLLAERTWDEPLKWIARPQSHDTGVYLCAEHVLEGQEKIWPQGPMVLSLEGAIASRDHFAPTEGKLFLSFGKDARVRLEAKAEPRRSGKEGFISQKKVWDWEWQYNVRNEREKPVLVRVECPLPQTVTEGFEARVTSRPDTKSEDKTLFWEFELAPGSDRELLHSVRVTGPADTRVAPLAP